MSVLVLCLDIDLAKLIVAQAKFAYSCLFFIYMTLSDF